MLRARAQPSVSTPLLGATHGPGATVWRVLGTCRQPLMPRRAGQGSARFWLQSRRLRTGSARPAAAAAAAAARTAPPLPARRRSDVQFSGAVAQSCKLFCRVVAAPSVSRTRNVISRIVSKAHWFAKNTQWQSKLKNNKQTGESCQHESVPHQKLTEKLRSSDLAWCHHRGGM